MSILSAFVAYVVVDWCSGVDWLVVGEICVLVVLSGGFASWFLSGIGGLSGLLLG